MIHGNETLLPLAVRLSCLHVRERLSLRFPLCAKRLVCHRCLVGEIISVDGDCSNWPLTVVVSVQKCFSECYFEIGDTVVELFEELSLSSQGPCGLWKLIFHK